MANAIPKAVGRFKIVRELGAGGQGAVYLAQDPQLGRQVAIKMLHTASAKQNERLLREARIISQLQHAHIVPLFDAGEQQGVPYLVCAYVDGGTLAAMLKEGPLPQGKAVEIASALLDALNYAHDQQVLHLDIKPANVMLGQYGVPMLMDFGIARNMQEAALTQEGVTGSPQYMAPESIANEGMDARSDIYSLGMLLYEMVAGVPAHAGDTLFQILNKVANEKIVPPSKHNPSVDERLETIILKALARNKNERFPTAFEMRQALQAYAGAVGETKLDAHSTVEFLLRRMRSKGDFPALSNIITEINNITASESESAGKLARAILQDFSLTNKLIKLVNTASFGQFGGSINTISKAVVILGFETVRNIAQSLILLEFMQNRPLATQLKDEVVGSFAAGVVATQLAVGHNVRDAEEVMICAMFHNLGRVLATYYFFEESQEVERLVEQGTPAEQAEVRVLGITYNHLGVEVARGWNFPQRMLQGMTKLPLNEKPHRAHGNENQLSLVSNLANELCQAAAASSPHEKEKALSQLSLRYGDALDINERKLNKALENGLAELSKRAVTLGIDTAHSPLVKRVKKWSGHSAEVQEKEPASASNGNGMAGVQGIEAAVNDAGKSAQQASAPDAEAILSAGIQDVTNTLVDDFKLNDLLLMVLETIYRGLGFKRALICIRDNKSNMMTARIGLGEGAEALIPRFRFGLDYTPDVFHLAVEKCVDIVIEDVQDPKIVDKIPAWYRGHVSAKSFVLLPVVINKKSIGLFYADMDEANVLKISERQLSLLRTLRNQAVLAIKQKL